MKLYEINDKMRECIEDGFALDEETGEYWTADRIEDLQAEFADKLEACAVIAKEYEAEAEALKAEAAKLAARQKAAAKRAESLKSYMAAQMKRADLAKLQTTKCRLSFRTSKKCIVDDMEKIPALYVKTVTETKADLTAIKKAIAGGESIEGAHIEESKNLQLS